MLFVFPDSTEIRYLDEPPAPGTRVRSAAGRVWLVSDALQSGRATYTVFCVGRREYVREVRHGQGGVRDLATDLLELARRPLQPPEKIRRRRRKRGYVP